MDYPALVIPVTKVDPQVDVKVSREYLSADDEDIDKLCQFSFFFPFATIVLIPFDR